MHKAQRIKEITRGYYNKKNKVTDWNKWVFGGHNEAVVKWIKEISKKYKFDLENTLVAAYLHDIAYSWTDKNDPTHEEQSLNEIRKILVRENFTKQEVKFIVDDILTDHGVHDGQKLEPIEARVLATADALSHLTTDFFLVICWNHYLFRNKGLNDYKAWVLKKIERDFKNKIFFDEFKEIARPDYLALKWIFSTQNTLTKLKK